MEGEEIVFKIYATIRIVIIASETKTHVAEYGKLILSRVQMTALLIFLFLLDFTFCRPKNGYRQDCLPIYPIN